MPPLHGFSDNEFRTRDDWVRGTVALLKPLHKYFSPGKARVQIPIGTGAHFDEVAAQHEGFARPLWAVGALLAGSAGGQVDPELREVLQPWIDGFASGPDPDHEEYWGDIVGSDQRMVESEIISYALLAAPEVLYDPLSDAQKGHWVRWLRSLKGKTMPENNWRWFRVFANLALIKVCGLPKAEVWQDMESDLDLLEKFYVDEGWSTDGWWTGDSQATDLQLTSGRRDDGVGVARQADYYSGSFAIQFSQLLYSKYAADLDPSRAALYRERGRLFARNFVHYFDTDGSAIPFGRSLTYRFACGGFFAALAVAGVDVQQADSPLSHAGGIRGYLSRHMRWWSKHSDDIFYSDGTMSIGWLYPNLHMAEDYNSPQSPYWCMKTLIAVALGPQHPFWMVKEANAGPLLNKSVVLRPPGHIICNHPYSNHHFLLSTRQFVAWPLKANKAKYSKFAYSSAFGFSVPVGEHISQIAPDSTLALSRDGGETWTTKWKWAQEPTFSTAKAWYNDPEKDTGLGSRERVFEDIPISTVTWWPWGDRSVAIETILIPPTQRWPDWHVRIHKFTIAPDVRPGTLPTLQVVEGGFAIYGRYSKSRRHLSRLEDELADAKLGETEGYVESAQSALILSSAGASGIVSQGAQIPRTTVSKPNSYALRPSPNTNIVCPRTLIPVAQISLDNLVPGDIRSFYVVTYVFAISTEANGGIKSGFGKASNVDRKSLKERWLDVPRVTFGDWPNESASDATLDEIVLTGNSFE